MPDCDSAGTAERSYPTSEVGGWWWGVAERRYPVFEVRGRRRHPTPLSPRPGAAGGRSYPTPEARSGGWEDQPHIQGAVAVLAQEGLEELSHVEGQEGRR